MIAPATLVTDTELQLPKPSLVRETDTRTALTRGLSEYLGQLVFNAQGGRQLRFDKVLNTWAEPEDNAHYPRAAVYSDDMGVYDASSFTPQPPNARNQIPGTNKYLVKSSEFTLEIKVEIWANDPPARRELVAGMESAFNPVDWMYGFVLGLPFYYGERAVYELKALRYMDTEEDAMRRYRKAAFILSSQVSQVNVFEYPAAKPSFRLDEIGPDVLLTGPNVVIQDC